MTRLGERSNRAEHGCDIARHVRAAFEIGELNRASSSQLAHTILSDLEVSVQQHGFEIHGTEKRTRAEAQQVRSRYKE